MLQRLHGRLFRCLSSSCAAALSAVLLLAACNGNGGSHDSGGPVYTPGGGSGSSGSPGEDTTDDSSGSYTAEDFLNYSNAGDPGKIIQLVSGGSEEAQTQTVTMSASDLGLPAGGSVTLTITGPGISYSGTAAADADGNVHFAIPRPVTGTKITVELTVQDAGGISLFAGSSTQDVDEDGNLEVKLVRQFWTLPASLTVTASPAAIAYNETDPASTSVSFSITNLTGVPAGAVLSYSWKDPDGNEVGTASSLTLTAGEMLGTGFTILHDSETRTYSVEVSYTEPSGEQVTSSGSATATIATTATLTLSGSGLQTEGERMVLVLPKGGSGVTVSADVLCFDGTPAFSWDKDMTDNTIALSATSGTSVTVSPSLGGMTAVTVTADLGDRTLTKYLDVYVLDVTISGTDVPSAAASPIIITNQSDDSTNLTASLTGLSVSGVSYEWNVASASVASASPLSGTAAATTTVTPASTGTTEVKVRASYKGVYSGWCTRTLNVAGLTVTLTPGGAAAGDFVMKMSETSGVIRYASVAHGTGLETIDWTISEGSAVTINGTSTTSRTLTPAAGGKSKITVSTSVNGRTLSKSFYVYVLDLVLGGTGLPTSDTDPITMLCTASASAALTASLDGLSGLEDVSYGWVIGDTTVIAASSTNTDSTTLTPVNAGSTTVKASATYGGVTVYSAVRDVNVAGFTLTASALNGLTNEGSDTYFVTPGFGGTSYVSFTYSFTGIDASDVTYISDVDKFTSSDNSVVTFGARNSGQACQADVSAGGSGSVTVTATVKLTTGEYISASKTLTILRLVLSVDGTAVSWNPNALDGTNHTLSASLQGASGTCTYDWTTSDSSVISLSSTTDASPTASCVAAGSSTITVTVHYGGNDYEGSKELFVP